MLKLRMVDKNILDHYTDLPVGEVLRRARLGFGMELAYASARLNIRKEHLQAIEDNDITRLPGRVYAVGFVRAYADFLQLDSDKIVYMFKSQVIGHTITRDLNFPVPVTETRNPAWWMVTASLGTLAVIGLLFWLLGGTSDTEAKPELPASVAATTKPESKPSLDAVEAEEPIVQGDGKLEITANTEAAWVEIRSSDDPDKIIFSRVLKKGESYTAPDMNDLLLSTGNAEGLSVTWEGKAIDVFEGRKGIVRNLPVSALSAYKTQPQVTEPASGAEESTPIKAEAAKKAAE
ncbi:MAG TPA: RodZ domain-containing protein [Alphaproteobacteria bacterium]